jgi:hypothetical protein
MTKTEKAGTIIGAAAGLIEGLVTVFTGSDTNGMPKFLYPIISTYIGASFIWGWTTLTLAGWKPSSWADISVSRMWGEYIGKFIVSCLICIFAMPIRIVKEIIKK